MEMKQIIKELEDKLEEAKTQMEDWVAKEKFWKAAVETAHKEMSLLEDNIGSLEMMIEAAKEGHFGLTEKKAKVEAVIGTAETKAEEPEAEKAEEETPVKDKRTDDNRHKGACVIKLNQYDNVDDRWKTQKAAARGLNWDQSSVSKFMKLDKDQQIRKKGFALIWEY